MGHRYLNSYLGRRLKAVFLAAVMLCGAPGTARAAPPGETCTADMAAVSASQDFFAISQDFRLLKTAPLTGQYVESLMRDPQNNLQFCVDPGPPERGPSATLASYSALDKKMHVSAKTDLRPFVHESFHAAQHINGANDIFGLQDSDLIAGNLLLEASAVGYSFMYFKETNQLRFFSNSFFDSGPDFSFDMGHAFNSAYDKTWKSLENADPQIRQEKSLEAGGRAVVSGLLNGANPVWLETYLIGATNNRDYFINHHNTKISFDAGYAERRDDIYAKVGRVSDKLNIMPEEFLGAGADLRIAAVLKKAGYVPQAPSRPPKNMLARSENK